MIARDEQVHVSLLQLDGDMLVLPKAAVLEVLPGERVEAASGDIAPIWLAGWCDFGDERLPVLRFEVLNGGAVPPVSRRARLAVVDGASFRLAFLIQGYPHLAALNRTAVESLPLRPSDHADRLLARVRIARHEAVIPDLDALSAEVDAIAAPRSEPVSV